MNAIRCCIACIFPFGVLDVIRVVHVNGHVEEFGHTVRVADVMESNPKHVVKSLDAFILSPNAELKKGHIYILVPMEEKREGCCCKAAKRRRRRRRKEGVGGAANGGGKINSHMDRYLSEIMSEKKGSSERRGRVGVWRPHLDSISEVASDAS